MKGITLILVVYIIYMLNFFKTTVSIAHPLTYFDNDMLYHPIENTKEPRNMICKLGNYGVFVLSLFIILREMSLLTIIEKNKLNVSRFVFSMVMLLSFLNLNACLYLIPYFIFEIVYFIRV